MRDPRELGRRAALPLVPDSGDACVVSLGRREMTQALHPQVLSARLLSEWRMKVWLGAVLALVFCTGYFTLQRVPIRPIATLEPMWLDRAIAFSPDWVWVYQSMYLLFPTAWLAPTRDDLRRYATGFLLVIFVGFACFLLWPVTGPRPLNAPREGMFGLLLAYDGVLNTFPSLHMALGTYAACFTAGVVGRRARRWTIVVLGAWVALVGYATMATKRHYFVDIPAGVFLGWIGHAVAMRLQRATVAMGTLAAAPGGTA